MSKKFLNQYCVYCLNYFEELTEDHIFPRAWYPDSTPKDIEKWVAPACFKCNNKLGKIEEEIYKKLAICTNSNDIAASGISEKAVHLYDLSSATNERDKKRKEANLKKILPSLMYTDKMPKGLLKNFGPVKNTPHKSTLIHVSIPKLLNPITEKIVRGLEFKLMGKLINTNRKIKTIHLPDSAEVVALELAQLNNVLEKSGVKVNRGPGFIVRYAKDIYGSMLYHITIWGKWEIWAAVFVKGLNINY